MILETGYGHRQPATRSGLSIERDGRSAWPHLDSTAVRDHASDALARYGLVVVTILVIGLFSAPSVHLLHDAGFEYRTMGADAAARSHPSAADLGGTDPSVAANFGLCELVVAG
jgi:hypothetical protein